jgi:hypothetical protein
LSLELHTLPLLAAAAAVILVGVTLALQPLLLQAAVSAVGLIALLVEMAAPAAAALAAQVMALAPAAQARLDRVMAAAAALIM